MVAKAVKRQVCSGVQFDDAANVTARDGLAAGQIACGSGLKLSANGAARWKLGCACVCWTRASPSLLRVRSWKEVAVAGWLVTEMVAGYRDFQDTGRLGLIGNVRGQTLVLMRRVCTGQRALLRARISTAVLEQCVCMYNYQGAFSTNRKGKGDGSVI